MRFLPFVMVLFAFSCINESKVFDANILKANRELKKYALNPEGQGFEVEGLPIRSYYYEGDLYFLDGPSSLINVYSLSGKLIATKGVKGEAPWEIGSPWYYYPSSNQGYYLHDYTMQMIKEYDSKGKLIEYVKLPYLRNNIVALKDGLFLTLEEVSKDLMFKVYNFKEKKVIHTLSTKRILNDEKIDQIGNYLFYAFQGNFSRNESNVISYQFTYLDKFILFNSDGTVKKVCNLINAFDVPDVEYSESKGIAIVPEIHSALCSKMSANYFFTIATNTGQFTKQSKYYLDIYSSDDGTYKGSVEIPLLEEHVRPWDMVCDESNSIYILYENMKMVKYKLNEK